MSGYVGILFSFSSLDVNAHFVFTDFEWAIKHVHVSLDTIIYKNYLDIDSKFITNYFKNEYKPNVSLVLVYLKHSSATILRILWKSLKYAVGWNETSL